MAKGLSQIPALPASQGHFWTPAAIRAIMVDGTGEYMAETFLEEAAPKIRRGSRQDGSAENMNQLFEVLTQVALLLAAIFVMTAIGFAVVRSYRGGKAEDRLGSSDLMSKFRDLHEEGGLSDEEFRTIKTKLARELKAELNDNSSSG